MIQITRIRSKFTKTYRRFASGVLSAYGHDIRFNYDITGVRIKEDDLNLLAEEAESRAREMLAKDYISGDLCCLLVSPSGNSEKELFGNWAISN